MTLPERRDARGELIPRDTVIYDVKMRGCDRSFWKTLTGDPSIAANKLRLNAEEAASYFQFLFGTFEFAVNVPAVPTAGEDTYDNGIGTANDVWVKNYHLEYLVDKLGEPI